MQVINIDKTFNELSIGTVINDTALVVRCQKRFDRVIGDCFATWVAICFDVANPIHSYVVWEVIARPEGWSAGSGDYRKTLTEAVEAYQNRGGHIG